MINENCVKDLMLVIEDRLKYKRSGKVIPVKIKDVMYKEPLKQYPHEDVYTAITFLIQSNLVTVYLPKSNPRLYKVNSITPDGYKFLKAIIDTTLWSKIKPLISTENISVILETISLFFSK